MSTTKSSGPSTAQLQARVREARAHVVADVEALKSEIAPESLKERALGAAERSLAAVARRSLSRLRDVPRTLAVSARNHPLPTAAIGVGVILLVWRMRGGRGRGA